MQVGQDLPSPVSADTYEKPLINQDEQQFVENLALDGMEAEEPEEEKEVLAKDDAVDKEPLQVNELTEPTAAPQLPEKEDEIEDDEDTEVLFDSTNTDLDIADKEDQKNKRLTQIDLDELEDLGTLLVSEFDCFKV